MDAIYFNVSFFEICCSSLTSVFSFAFDSKGDDTFLITDIHQNISTSSHKSVHDLIKCEEMGISRNMTSCDSCSKNNMVYIYNDKMDNSSAIYQRFFQYCLDNVHSIQQNLFFYYEKVNCPIFNKVDITFLTHIRIGELVLGVI